MFDEIGDSSEPPFLRFRRLSAKLNEVAQAPRSRLNSEEVNRAADFYVHSLRSMVVLFRDARFILTTQPTTHFWADPILEPGYHYFVAQLEEFPEKFPNVAAYFDFNPMLKPKWADLSIDDCHLNDEGQMAVAKKLAQLILTP